MTTLISSKHFRYPKFLQHIHANSTRYVIPQFLTIRFFFLARTSVLIR